MPQSIPKVAQVEDYDSDESSVKPGTKKEARRKYPMAPPPKALDRYKNAPVDGASDSGYSSTQASNASANVQTAGAVQPPPRPSTAHAQAKPKPVVHRTDSQPTRPRAPSRSNSTSRRGSDLCADPYCQHSTCLAVRSSGRRISITPQQPPQYAPQYAVSPVAYQQMPSYQYAQVTHVQSSQTVPTLSSFPQRRSGSTSRQTRPMSIAGYPNIPQSGTSTPGPPPANSAYQHAEYQNLAEQWAQYWHKLQLAQQQQAYQQQQAAAYAAAASQQQQAYPVQPQVSPVNVSPTSPKFSHSARLQRAYSARSATPSSAAPASNPHPLTRSTSIRHTSTRAYNIPGAFPGTEPGSSEPDSDSDSSSSMSEEEYERERRARARDSRLMSSSSQRRPSIKRQYATTPILPTSRVSREILQRNPHSNNLDYISSSDNNRDSDHTTRAMINQPRTTYTNTDSTRSSRRPSLSTTASSGRTRATTLSSATSGMASLVLEQKGRRVEYMSKRDQAKYAREQQLLLEEERRREAIERYQDQVSGGKVPELTAEKLKMASMHSAAGGHGYAHSRKSSRSSSRAYNPNEGVRIESGGTTIHVYGDQKVEMIPGRDGMAASLVIGRPGGDGKESTYLGGSSKSSGSRVGRSRGMSQGPSQAGSQRESDVGAGVRREREVSMQEEQPAT